MNYISTASFAKKLGVKPTGLLHKELRTRKYIKYVEKKGWKVTEKGKSIGGKDSDEGEYGNTWPLWPENSPEITEICEEIKKSTEKSKKPKKEKPKKGTTAWKRYNLTRKKVWGLCKGKCNICKSPVDLMFHQLDKEESYTPRNVKIICYQCQKDKIYEIFNWECFRCGSEKKLEIDHVIPKAKGGRDSIENLQLLCQKCNREKGTSISL